MKVSVITACRNSAATIDDTLQSVLDQRSSYPDIEHIIVDGASDDGTMQVIEQRREQIDRLISEPDAGIYDALNKGIEAASGDLLGFLHADDVYADTNVIRDIVAAIGEESADATYADLVYVDRREPSRIVRRWVAGEYGEGAFLRGWMPPHPTFFAKRSCYERLGRYDPRLETAADYELMLRFIHKHRIRLAYLPRVAVHMRVGGASSGALAARLRAHREDRAAWKMNGLQPGWFTLLRKPLSKLRQFGP